MYYLAGKESFLHHQGNMDYNFSNNYLVIAKSTQQQMYLCNVLLSNYLIIKSLNIGTIHFSVLFIQLAH